MAHKSWEQKALMWPWVWEGAQQRAAHGACASSFGGRWQQKKGDPFWLKEKKS